MTLSKDDFDRETWDVVDAYFRVNKGYQLVKHQIESFNDFVLRKLDQIIEGFNNIEIHHNYLPDVNKFKYILTLEVKNPTLNKPIIYEKDGSTKLMTPNDARQRNFSYSSVLTVDVHVTTKTYSPSESCDGLDYVVERKVLNNVMLGKIPIMVKSNYCILRNVQNTTQECKYDYGSYFIINGNEKVVISQDRISENKTFVFVNNKVSTYSHIAEIRSVQENKLGVPKITTLKLSAKANQFGRYIRANIHHIKHDIPVFILFKALGLHNDKEILRYIVHDIDVPGSQIILNELIGCVEEANQVVCPKSALEYLSRYLNISGYPKEVLNHKVQRMNIIRNILEKEFLPHVGRDFHKKALYLGYMVNKLLKCYLGIKEFDDRDSYVNKRVDTPGVLMANLFRQYYGKMIKDMKNMIQKEINSGSWKATNKFINVINKINISKIIKSTIIDSGMRYALATGNWGIKSNKNKQGVAQVLNRMTYSATISHMRRINTPIEKSGKLIQPRKLHSTQWGIICPSECFDPDTPILMWEGIIKKAKEIVVGDYLIDDKGNAVKVRTTCSGFKEMYEVIPYKNNFVSHTVTDNHILTLKARHHTTNNSYTFRWFDKDKMRYTSKSFATVEDMESFKSKIDDVIDITIEDYLSLPESVQKELYLFKSDGINWEHKDVALDPYILGMWLGDGYGFATADKELLDKYKLTENKHIPLDYLVNDRKTRLAVLAGLIDTDGSVRSDGHEIRITQEEKNYKIIYDTEFLARSLGFSCHINEGGEKREKPYKELSITGSNLYEIPTVLPLNKSDNPTSESSFLQSSFTLKKKELQPFVGWQLEGNGRFLLGDMIVSHNTPEGASVGLVKNMAMMACITVASNSFNVRELLSELGTVIFAPSNIDRMAHFTKVMLNGDIVGTHEDPTELCRQLRRLKRKGIINVYTSVVWNVRNHEVQICTEGGRCVRPLYIVDEQAGDIRLSKDIAEKLRDGSINWTDLVIGNDYEIDDAIVEFLDVEEVNASMIAMKHADLFKGTKGSLLPIKYTHLEIHPSLILGVLASLIPFSDHNQAPRNTYQCLDPETPVLMADGGQKPIKDVKVGEEVVTFHPETKETSITKVINQYVRSSIKPIVKITTISGREIIATNDHMFMTNKGWLRVQDFEVDTKIGVAVYATGIGGGDRALARISGFILASQGVVTLNTDFDRSLFEADLKAIGASWNHELVNQLQSKGVSWIMDANKAIKKEFLAGAMSCHPVKDMHVVLRALLKEFEIETDENLQFSSPNDVIRYVQCVAPCYNTSHLMEVALTAEFYKVEDAMTFDAWKQCVEIKTRSMFMPIQSVWPMPDGLIADITTESDNHSFIANGFLSHNSAQCKQAIGIYALNFRDRYDTMGHVLNYPQKPLVKTRMSSILNNDEMPNGINVIVAIATFTGFNQEDSIILNRSSVDRGLFVSTYFKTYKEQNNKNHSTGEEEFFTKPETTKGMKPYNYDKLDTDGFVRENSYVQAGDVIIGKCMPNKNGSVMTYKDTSVALKNNDTGFVDRNVHSDKHFTTVNGEGYNFCKVRLRNHRTPSIGDKFSTRSGQKGTTGMLYRQEDMPFTKDGIVPDVIMNPHAIPSRMTIGQLIECIMGKACTVLGSYGDATPFTDLTVEEVAKVLQDTCGLERYGNEIMYNPRTGEQMTTDIFIGPTYYQRLKHMTIDKIHSRASSGPIVLLTHQPSDGRQREGGLRLGEMEVECNWAHGIQQFLKERMMECSDNFRVYTCKQCGLMATVNKDRNIYSCRNCKNTSNFSEIRIPYACKLLLQEVQTMGIGTKFITGS